MDHVVLSWTPSGLHRRIRLGRARHRPREWQANERKEGPSSRGHDRAWLPPEQRAEARTLRLQNGGKGIAAAGPGDGWELSAHDRRLSVVGQRHQKFAGRLKR